MATIKADIIAKLQRDILRLEGFTSKSNPAINIGLELMKDAFPNGSFPLGAVHEFISSSLENSAATSGFVSGLLASLTRNSGATIWISSSRTLFPPALKTLGLEPDQFIFIDVQKDKDVLWAMDEALKCGALSAVVGEVREIDFTMSRRLQLAVERSKVTGFILRNNFRKLNTTACVSRWKITPLPSESTDTLPGIGFPNWRVELQRMRNGKSGVWNIQFINGMFVPIDKSEFIFQTQEKKAG